MATLKAQYRADALALADGDPVATWPDLIASPDQDAVQGDSDLQPTYKVAVPGVARAGVLFDVSTFAQELDVAALVDSLTAQMTFVFVVSNAVVSSDIAIVSSLSTSPAGAVFDAYFAVDEVDVTGGTAASFAERLMAGGVFALLLDDTSGGSKMKLYQDGVRVVLEVMADAMEVVDLKLGGFKAMAGGSAYVHEVRAYQGLLTPQEIVDLTIALRDYWFHVQTYPGSQLNGGLD